MPAFLYNADSGFPADDPLTRVAIDFANERLSDKLAPFRDATGAVVVVEGVSMYVPAEALRTTFAALHDAFPSHALICDLMTGTFARRFGGPLRARIEELGGTFSELLDDPAAFVASCGYRLSATRSIPAAAVDFGTVRVPRWLLATLLRSLRDGYRVYVFDAVAGTG